MLGIRGAGFQPADAWQAGSLPHECFETPFSGGRSAAMRYAICNETFEGWDHGRVCRFVAGLGYTGLELAPFTLAPRITDVSPARRRELRQQAEDAGVTILGLHWLLAKTEGLHLTSA